jgi:hypothetical protein
LCSISLISDKRRRRSAAKYAFRRGYRKKAKTHLITRGSNIPELAVVY